jgi:tight adherence protein B
MSTFLIFLAATLLMGSLTASRFGVVAWSDRFAQWLQADLHVLNRMEEIPQIFHLTLFSCSAAALLGTLLYGWILGALLAACTLLLCKSYFVYGRLRYVNRIEAQLPGTLEALAAALQAGQSLPQAVAWVAREAPAPISHEFARVSHELTLGRSIEEALFAMVDRIPGKGLRTLAMTIGPLRSMGANLVPALENMSTLLRRRQITEAKLKTLTSQGRMQLWVMAAVMPALLVVLHLMAPEFITPLFATPNGNLVLGVALGLQGMALLLARRILDGSRMWKPRRGAT